jgi:hypothetical protein
MSQKTPQGFQGGHRLPGKRDWLWMLGMAMLGALLGFVLNATTGKGINLGIALGLGQPEAAEPAAQEQP